MFTGLIQAIGEIQAVRCTESLSSFDITVEDFCKDLSLGDSIAVNGVCLTVTAFTENFFTVDAVQETLRVTNLGSLIEGSRVNLEKALRAGDRLGGHYVSGHVDGLGKVLSLRSETGNYLLEIAIPQELRPYFVAKGSVTLEGVSLTIVDCTESTFRVTLIPETLKRTTLADKQAGDLLNVETDLFAKYIVQHMSRFS